MRNQLRRIVRVACIAVALFALQELCAQTSQRLAVPQSVDKWITTTFAKGKVPPFSFVYGGKNSAGFIRGWKHSIAKIESADEAVVRYDVIYQDPATGLVIKCEISGFPHFGAVEWVLYATNTGAENTPQITQLRCVDFTMDSKVGADYTLLHAMGSNGARADFMPMLQPVAPGEEIILAPKHGRSSDTLSFPFFNIMSSENKGVVVGVGWTGTWYADIAADDKSVTLQSGMQQFDSYLYPQERIRTPRVAMLFWQGEDFMVGQNAFRQFMLTHHTRKVDDSYGHSPMCAGFDWGDPSPCNEYTCLTEEYAVALIKRHKQFGLTPEVFWLDAGWYAGSGAPNTEGKNWYNTVGSWSVDAERFPRGLKPLADAAHAVGAKFMVWFEPERVYQGTMIAEQYPDWLLKLSDSHPQMLFNLGDKEALAWLCKHIGDFIEENAIDYYRQDFNMPISPFWEANDEENRIGMCEIRHIEGLYAYWDYLLERFPDMVIDNCASGGRRLDLETMSRSIPLWRTDYSYGEPNGYQCHTYGLNLFLPLHGTGLYKSDYYSFLSSMNSAIAMNWAITIRGEKLGDMQRTKREFAELRPYYMEDYYPLTGIKDLTGENVWLAYQLHRKSDNSGIVVAFRRAESAEAECAVALKALNPSQNYEVYNVIDGSVCNKSGEELLKMLTLTIDEPRGALLLKYKPVE